MAAVAEGDYATCANASCAGVVQTAQCVSAHADVGAAEGVRALVKSMG
jgi:hypothetical protein